MEYGIRELSELAGISARTLRYYDEMDLLKPLYTSDAGYRFYGEKEVKLLQQILFYRESGMELQQIRNILYNETFDLNAALLEHLQELKKKRRNIDRLIDNVNNTIASMKGEYDMDNKERFEAFKQNAVEENEKLYGAEVREKYGDDEVDASNRKMLKMTEEEYQKFKELEQAVLSELESAVRNGAAAESEEAGRIVKLHKDWLLMTWSQYTPEAHKGIGMMYEADERFMKYYDKNVQGCTSFLRKAIDYHA